MGTFFRLYRKKSDISKEEVNDELAKVAILKTVFDVFNFQYIIQIGLLVDTHLYAS